jgi:hypothetical protein
MPSVRFYVCFLSYLNRLSERIVDSGRKGGCNGEKVRMAEGRAERGATAFWLFIPHPGGLKLSGGGGEEGEIIEKDNATREDRVQVKD